jgi:pyruvate formate lyase activating enzyme
MKELGPDVPLHFTAFHPDWKMTDIAATPASTLTRARDIGVANGLHYVYTGNVHDTAGGTTYCPGCKAPVVVRDWYRILRYALTPEGRCNSCGTAIAGRYEQFGKAFGPRRIPVRLASLAQ